MVNGTQEPMQKRISSRIQARKMDNNKITKYFARTRSKQSHNDKSIGSSISDDSISIENGVSSMNTSPLTPPSDKCLILKSGPLSPHKIQALNEEKLRLDVPLSPSAALSKLKLISPKKIKFDQKKSSLQRKLTSQLNHITTESSDAKVPSDKCRKPVNGYLKQEPKSNFRNTQVTEYFPIRRSHRKPKAALLQERQKEMEQRILSSKEEGLKVKLFGSKGRGVVTTRAFSKGEMVVEYVGELIDTKKAKEREEKYAQDNSKGCYMYYFTYQNTQYCIDATEESPYLGRLVNHSRSGNLLTKTVEVGGRPHLILIAKKDIEAGTELLYDYGDRSKQALQDHPWLAL